MLAFHENVELVSSDSDQNFVQQGGPAPSRTALSRLILVPPIALIMAFGVMWLAWHPAAPPEEAARAVRRAASSDAEKAAHAIESIIGDEHLFPLDRPSIAGIRSMEGDNDHGLTWKYLQTDCLTQRQDLAAKYFKDAKCKNVLEVGGYYVPLTHSSKFYGGGPYTELYVNVDPSVHNASAVERAGKAGKFYEVNVPMLLGEWAAETAEGGHLFEKVPEFDCVIDVGAWSAQFGTEEKLAAWKQVTKHAKVVVLESPMSVHIEGICLGEPTLFENGLCEDLHTVVRCTSDPASMSAVSVPAQLERYLKVYSRHTGECPDPTYDVTCHSGYSYLDNE